MHTRPDDARMKEVPVNLVPWLLVVHVFGAMLAFGPTYTFPLIASLGSKEPGHANFATRVSYAITMRFVEPLAILQGITGVGLILTAKIDIFTARWLEIAILIYLAALGLALFVQAPTVKKIIEMTSTPPPPEAPPGPPPALLVLIHRVQRGGIFLSVAVAVIVILMIGKPTF